MAKEKGGSSGIRFHVTGDKINAMTWRQFEKLEALNSRDQLLADKREVLALFLVDEQDEPLPPEAANDALLALRVDQINEITAQFWEALMERAVPKASDTPSSPPSSTEDESPTGSEP